MVGELISELEHSWKAILLRVPGAIPHGAPGPLPSWWTGEGDVRTSVRRAAQKANRRWVVGLRGSGAKGERPLGDDRCDDVFNATGWLLQYVD